MEWPLSGLRVADRFWEDVIIGTRPASTDSSRRFR